MGWWVGYLRVGEEVIVESMALYAQCWTKLEDFDIHHQ